MSLVASPDIASLPEKVRTAITQAPVQLNIFKMMANDETCFIPMTRLGGTILSRQKLDAKLRELAILLVAKIEGGEYEWIQHVPIAIERNLIGSPCFSDVERAALRFTEELVNRVRADEATVRELMSPCHPVKLSS
ncbi:MAG TPA: carboxymuconolactone decarboxylase family protein [Candidatus Binataceae bacterium]|nr:carboxymuconolactone decarboxylase family protein [Candidatus Binataceae bacterium]